MTYALCHLIDQKLLLLLITAISTTTTCSSYYYITATITTSPQHHQKGKESGPLNLEEGKNTYGGFAVCSGSSELPVWLSVLLGTAAGHHNDGCWNRGTRP